MIYLSKFLTSDIGKSYRKISQIIKAKAEGKTIVLALDFDKTTIVDAVSAPSQWDAISNSFPDEVNKEFKKMKKKYLPLFEKGEMMTNDYVKWLNKPFSTWRENGLDKRQILNVANSLRIRPGIKELIEFFGRNNTCIISFGITEIIENFLQLNGLKEVKVFANSIFKTATADNAVTPISKGIHLRSFMKQKAVDIKHVTAIGDSVGDQEMFLKESLNVIIKNKNGHPIDKIRNVDIIVEEISTFNALLP